MREILFRGKEIETGKWIYGAFVPDALEGSNDLVSWGFIRNYNREIHKMQTVEVDRETVGQFTGLTDRNGKKIFEGDIIKLLKCKDAVCTLKGGNPNYYFQGKDGRYEMSEEPHNPECFEVIGNIYDNPELLGESHEHH